MKGTCEYCGKLNIDGRHRNLCSKNPKNLAVENNIIGLTPVADPLLIGVIVPKVPENATSKPVEPTRGGLKCPDCGGVAIMLNSLDYRCPNCGDRELRRPMPTKGI